MKLFVTLAALASTTVFAQGRSPAPLANLTRVRSALTVGGTSFEMSGVGECTHTAEGTVFNAPSAIWTAQQSSQNRLVNLTLFGLKGGGDMISLLVSIDGKTHRVVTTKGAGSGPAKGTGTIRMTPAATGGTFTIDATADSGARITGTVTCSGFTKSQENG